MIRTARDEDVPALMAMGRAFVAEAGYAEIIPFDEKSFYRTLEILAQANLLRVFDVGGRVIGMAGADVAPAICNHSVILGREAFWYVDPEYRNGRGTPLLHAIEECARAKGAQFFDAIAEEKGGRAPALGRVYRREGYRVAEHTYRKVL